MEQCTLERYLGYCDEDSQESKDHVNSVTEFESRDSCLHYEWQGNSLLERR